MSSERLSEHVYRLALPSRTMPPFDTTNTYLIYDRGVGVVVDPGFGEKASLSLLEAALSQLGVTLVKAVLLTHSHADHRAGLELVKSAFDAPAVYLHPAEFSRMDDEGQLHGLQGDRVVTVGDVDVHALHTPGHSPGHLCFHLPSDGVLLAGDLVAGRGSVWVGVPEGDVSHYLSSLDLVMTIPALSKLGPGHGEASDEPYRLLGDARDHRLEREKQVLAAVASPRKLAQIRDEVYGGALEGQLQRAAEASLLAHLRKLMAEMRVVHLGEDEQGPFVARS